MDNVQERAWPHCESKNYKSSRRHARPSQTSGITVCSGDHQCWCNSFGGQSATLSQVSNALDPTTWTAWETLFHVYTLEHKLPTLSASQDHCSTMYYIPNILGPHSLPIKYKRFSGGRVYLSPRCLLDSPKEFFTKSKTWSSFTHWIWLCWSGEVWSRNLGYPVCSPGERLKILTPRLQSKNLGFGFHILYKQTTAWCAIGEKTASNLDVRW